MEKVLEVDSSAVAARIQQMRETLEPPKQEGSDTKNTKVLNITFTGEMFKFIENLSAAVRQKPTEFIRSAVHFYVYIWVRCIAKGGTLELVLPSGEREGIRIGAIPPLKDTPTNESKVNTNPTMERHAVVAN